MIDDRSNDACQASRGVAIPNCSMPMMFSAGGSWGVSRSEMLIRTGAI